MSVISAAMIETPEKPACILRSGNFNMSNQSTHHQDVSKKTKKIDTLSKILEPL